MKNLQGKNVLVTGGAKGIGREIAKRFVQEGSNVRIVDIDKTALELLDPYVFTRTHLDITHEILVEDCLGQLPIDILVNNAAITEGDDYMGIMSVNCNGTRYVTETILRGMKERRSGSIIFITSIHTAMAFQGDATYDSSKHWAIGYMRARALELAHLGIRFNAVAPGATEQAGPNTGLPKDVYESVVNRIPMKRWGLPRDIASAVAFLASDEASYITGVELRVDGGLAIKNPLRD